MNKRILKSLIVILLFACQDQVIDNKCFRTIGLGEIDLCLPIIEGRTECYTNPIVQSEIISANDPTNTVLAFYIDNDDHKELVNTGVIPTDNTFKVYTPYMSSSRAMDTTDMKEILLLMTSGFMDNSEKEGYSESFIEGGAKDIPSPEIIEKYDENNNSSTVIVIMNINTNGIETPTAVSINAVLVKGKILFISHYLKITDANSVTILKNNSNQFINTFLRVNSSTTHSN